MNFIVHATPIGIEDEKVLDKVKSFQNELTSVIQKEENEIKSNLDKAESEVSNKNYANASKLLKTNIAKEKVSKQATDWIDQSIDVLSETENKWRDSFIGEWGQVPTIYEFYNNIKIEKYDGNKMKVGITSTQSPPASRIASIEVKADFKDGILTFGYDDDNWGNQGQGTIQLTSENEINLKINQTYTNENANWSLGGSGAWPKITEDIKKQAALKDADAKKKAEDEEKKSLARITQRRGTLTVYITDIQYSASLKVSQLNFNVINDANADGMAFAVWNFEFYNANNKLISTNGGGTNALMPGEGIKSMMYVDGDIRNYAYFKLIPVTEGKYPINDPYKFSR
jgi:hypothetical protein